MNPYLFVVLISLFSCSFLPAQISIKGSDTLGAKMVPQLSKSFQKIHANSTFEIGAEGSSLGFKALIAGTCDIGMSSRPVNAAELKQFQEKGLELQEHVVAYDVIAVIVNDKNLIEELTLKQVEQIFTGEITSWKDLGGDGKINVYTRNTSSATYKTFQNLAMSGRGYGKNTQKVAGSFHPSDNIVPDPQSIGYCGLAYTFLKGVKPLKVNKIEPIAKNVESYPLSRKLYFYAVGEPKGSVKLFIDWVKKSPEAHKIINSIGFISLPQKMQNKAQ